MKNKILVLGSTGMLGKMVFYYLSKSHNFTVHGTARDKKRGILDFDAIKFVHNPDYFSELQSYDYVLNCIGIIKPYCKDEDIEGTRNAILVNALFPQIMGKHLSNSKTKIIQIATDCVYDGKKGNYIESDPHNPIDVYGKTKSLGEPLQENYLNIRCSIVGPEESGKTSLLEWFLSHNKGQTISGYEDHVWNGITTLQFAQLCESIIQENTFEKLRSFNHVLHYVPNETVTKYDLLNICNKEFEKSVTIKKERAAEGPIDRSLSSQYQLASNKNRRPMEEAIHNLRDFMANNPNF